MQDARLHVDIWFDVICPWCWIGKRRFERALAELPEKDSVTIAYRSYRLMPDLAPMPIEAVLRRRFGTDVHVEAVHAQFEKVAEAEGLPFSLVGTRVGDTVDAHRLIQAAAKTGKRAEAIERLYRAYFIERASIFDISTLVALASDIGLEPGIAEAALREQLFGDEILADQRAFQDVGGLGGVPFYLIGRDLKLSGARSQAEYSAALGSALSHQADDPPSQAAPATCHIDGCH